MSIRHLTSDATTESITAVLERDGCCVIDRLAEPSALQTVLDEMGPYIEATECGPDEFSGLATRRAGALVARSPASRTFVVNPTVLGAVGGILHDAANFRLHLSQIIAIGPGATPQPIHRDQWAFDFFEFPNGYEVQCNALWAMNDFTEANGATRVAPGTHRGEDKQKLNVDDTEPAEMEAGSVLLYTGAIYHGGGENRTDEYRYGLNLTYARAWLRQEENQYLSVPIEVARTLDHELLKLIGYAFGAYALGYIDDQNNPMDALFGGRDRGGDDGRRSHKSESIAVIGDIDIDALEKKGFSKTGV